MTSAMSRKDGQDVLWGQRREMALAFHRTLTARGWFLQRYARKGSTFLQTHLVRNEMPRGVGIKYSGNSGGDGLFHIALDSYFIWCSPNRRGFILEGK